MQIAIRKTSLAIIKPGTIFSCESCGDSMAWACRTDGGVIIRTHYGQSVIRSSNQISAVLLAQRLDNG